MSQAAPEVVSRAVVVKGYLPQLLQAAFLHAAHHAIKIGQIPGKIAANGVESSAYHR